MSIENKADIVLLKEIINTKDSLKRNKGRIALLEEENIQYKKELKELKELLMKSSNRVRYLTMPEFNEIMEEIE